MSKAIIFGASGQTGHYLTQILRHRGHAVITASRKDATCPIDVSDFQSVESLVSREKPEFIFHLAAHSTTRHDALFANHAAITTGTLNVLESALRHLPSARVFITGSGVQFVNDGQPIDESTPFEASSSYAMSRISSVYSARYYRRRGLATYVGYLFHHESPLRPASHVSQKIVQAAKAIAKGTQSELVLGDMSVSKEWTFAGDTAEAIALMLEQEKVTEAVIGSGKDYSIEKWVETCFSALGLDYRNHVRTIPGFVPEYPRLVSNPSLIRGLGWEPKVDLADLAKMMLDAESISVRAEH